MLAETTWKVHWAVCCGRPLSCLLMADSVEKSHLGMSRQEVITALGPLSKSEAAQMVYSHDGKLAGGFDETAWLILRFREEKLVSMRGGKTTTN